MMRPVIDTVVIFSGLSSDLSSRLFSDLHRSRPKTLCTTYMDSIIQAFFEATTGFEDGC